MSRRAEILSQVKSVPSMPAVVLKLREYLQNPEVNFGDLAKVIEYDPGLTANVLQLANSAYFGWAREIASVKESITRLGTKRIFQMVLCMSVAPLVRKPVRGYELDPEELWKHSIGTAICAEQLAIKRKLPEASDAFTVGLLHDVGKVVLGTFVEIDDEPIREIVELDHLAFDEAERMVLGIDHAEVAGILLQDWNLPEQVVSAARWHHDPRQADPEYQRLTDLVHVADVLCMKIGWGVGSEGLQYRLNEEAAERLQVNVEAAEDVVLKVIQGMDEMQDLFQSPTEGERDRVKRPARR